MTTDTFTTVQGETITATVDNYRVEPACEERWNVVADWRTDAAWAPGTSTVAIAEAYSWEDAQFIADAFNARTA